MWEKFRRKSKCTPPVYCEDLPLQVECAEILPPTTLDSSVGCVDSIYHSTHLTGNTVCHSDRKSGQFQVLHRSTWHWAIQLSASGRYVRACINMCIVSWTFCTCWSTPASFPRERVWLHSLFVLSQQWNPLSTLPCAWYDCQVLTLHWYQMYICTECADYEAVYNLWNGMVECNTGKGT